MRRLLLLSVAVFVLIASVPAARSQDKEKDDADEQRLKNAFLSTDNDSLAKFLSTRAKGSVDPKALDKLIEQLGDKDASVRNKACAELVMIGSPAEAKVRLTARDPDDTDVAALAKRVLAVLKDEPGNVTGAAVRLLAARRPAGTAEALLAYLPHSENEAVMEDIKTALAGVAYIEGKPDPAVLKALED